MSKPVFQKLWARKYAPFLASAFILAYLKNKRFGTGPNKLFLPEGGLMSYYFERGEFKNLSRNYEKFLRRQNLKQYAEVYEGEFRDFLDFAKKMSKTDPAKASRQKLAKLVRDFNDRLIQSSNFQFAAFLVLEGPVADLEKKLAKLPEGGRVSQVITTPYRETAITKARQDLLEIAKRKDWNAIPAYAKKYAWLPVYEPLDKPWTAKDFLRQAKAVKNAAKEIIEYRQQRKEALREYAKYFAAIKDSDLKKQVEIAHYFAYLKEMRDDYRRLAYYLLGSLLEKLGQMIGLNFKEVNHLTIPELADSIVAGKSIVSKIELKQREKAFAFELRNAKLKIYSGSKALQFAKKMASSEAAKEISGSTASTGLVRAKVSVIAHQGEFKKFKSGNVLVTAMTHPEFLPIMKKAKAIVTDEGGITCHAAIVSRELGIPCVIGTKNATRVLKDGDFVEVDATKGIVRKLK